MGSPITLVFEPGFFGSEPVHTALALAGGAAIVSAVVGVFTVLRAQSFAGHTLADVSSAGGAASPLLGISPLLGFLGVAAIAGWAMELVGAENPRERDLVTGIVLGAGLGLAALFLYLDVTLGGSRTGTTVAIMFGSMFSVPGSTVPTVIATSAATLVVVAVLYRPLLLCALSPDLAAVQGVPVRLIGLIYTLALALAVALSAVTIGAILSTALLIGPAATALNLAARPGRAIAAAVAIGIATTWGGILMAYDSYYWTPGHSWPVSFCVVVLIFAAYLASRLRERALPFVKPPRPGSAAMFESFMINAWIGATIVAALAGVVGFFVVLRGSAFAAHALPLGSFTGAAAASLFRFDPFVGLIAFAGLGVIGINRLGRGAHHDVATALSLVMLLALGGFFLSLTGAYSESVYALLFGTVLGISGGEINLVAAIAVLCVLLLAVLYRPLLLNAVSTDLAEAKGIGDQRIELGFLAILGLATAIAVPVVGALLVFSLMVGPPAAARFLTDRPGHAMLISVGLSLLTVWASIALAFALNWPVGFFVGALSALLYGLGRFWAWRQHPARRADARAGPPAQPRA